MKPVFKGICATRQLAKRQITWLRSWDDLTWLDSENIDSVTRNSIRMPLAFKSEFAVYNVIVFA